MVRLAQLLHAIAEGRLPEPVQFRSGDQIGQLKTRFNRISVGLAERHARVVEPLDFMRTSFDELKRFLEQAGADDEGRLQTRGRSSRAGSATM